VISKYINICILHSKCNILDINGIDLYVFHLTLSQMEYIYFILLIPMIVWMWFQLQRYTFCKLRKMVTRCHSNAHLYTHPSLDTHMCIQSFASEADIMTFMQKWVQKHDIQTGCKSFKQLAQCHRDLTSIYSDLTNWFTISHNLFGGSLSSLAPGKFDNVINEVCSYQYTGCFAFTEEEAGVYSGMIINSTVTRRGDYVCLHTPSNGKKAWISLGGTSNLKWILFFGKDTVTGHLIPVLVNYLEHKDRINIESMGVQSVIKSNPLSRITFTNVIVSTDCIVASPESGVSTQAWFYSIVSRLLSGRILLSGSALEGVTILYNKLVNKHKKSKVGFINQTLEEVRYKLDKMENIFNPVAQAYGRIVDTKVSCPRDLQDSIAFIKGFIPRECCKLIEKMRYISGGISFLEDSRFIEFWGAAYGGILAEGDSHLMAQLWMRTHMSTHVTSPSIWKLLFQLYFTPNPYQKWLHLSGDIIQQFDIIASRLVYT
jgi:alkylation response protein AidB-like acyl-CoA dehydrogenase